MQAPHDTSRLRTAYPERHEAFVEIKAHDSRVRLLPLFCVLSPAGGAPTWTHAEGRWAFGTPEGPVRVSLDGGAWRVADGNTSQAWKVAVEPCPVAGRRARKRRVRVFPGSGWL